MYFEETGTHYQIIENGYILLFPGVDDRDIDLNEYKFMRFDQDGNLIGDGWE